MPFKIETIISHLVTISPFVIIGSIAIGSMRANLTDLTKVVNLMMTQNQTYATKDSVQNLGSDIKDGFASVHRDMGDLSGLAATLRLLEKREDTEDHRIDALSSRADQNAQSTQQNTDGLSSLTRQLSSMQSDVTDLDRASKIPLGRR